MIDDFLTTPDDLPALRARRPSSRPLAAKAAPSPTDERSGVEVTGSTLVAPAIAASALLVVAMISLPSFEPIATLSKTPHGPWRIV